MTRNVFDELRETLDTLSERIGETGAEVESQVTDRFGRVSVDVAEDDGTYTVTADLPGFDRDDIDLTVREDVLHLRARHERESEESDEQYLRRERSRRSVSRTIRLPGTVDPDEASASFNNGVLTVTLPRVEEESGERIEIS